MLVCYSFKEKMSENMWCDGMASTACVENLSDHVVTDTELLNDLLSFTDPEITQKPVKKPKVECKEPPKNKQATLWETMDIHKKASNSRCKKKNIVSASEPHISNNMVMAYRKNPLNFGNQPVFYNQNKSQNSTSLFVKDNHYREKTLDQLDFLVKTSSLCFYYLKKQSYLKNIEEMCDKLNVFIYNKLKELLMKNNTASLMHFVIDIEDENLITECISLVVGLFKLANKNPAFYKIELDLKKAKWLELPSDYQRYVLEYKQIFVKPNSVLGVF